jgi:hypothetical protein
VVSELTQANTFLPHTAVKLQRTLEKKQQGVLNKAKQYKRIHLCAILYTHAKAKLDKIIGIVVRAVILHKIQPQ